MLRVNLRYVLHSVVAVSLVVFLKVLATMPMKYTGLDWYYSLNLPLMTPPAWVFGPVWLFIYMCMAGAIANILWIYRVGVIKHLSLLFFFHAIFHATWSYCFFGLQSPLYGLINISAMWLTLAWMMRIVYSYSKLSWYLLVPYFSWLTFAVYLNLQIFLLN